MNEVENVHRHFLASVCARVSVGDKELAEGNEVVSAVVSGPKPLNYEHPAIEVDNKYSQSKKVSEFYEI